MARSRLGLEPKLLIVDSSIATAPDPLALKSKIRLPIALDRSVDYTAGGRAFAGLRRDSRYELLSSARMLELWLTDADFTAERLALPEAMACGGGSDYREGLRAAYHCLPLKR